MTRALIRAWLLNYAWPAGQVVKRNIPNDVRGTA